MECINCLFYFYAYNFNIETLRNRINTLVQHDLHFYCVRNLLREVGLSKHWLGSKIGDQGYGDKSTQGANDGSTIQIQWLTIQPASR